jgi:hypothetical protein
MKDTKKIKRDQSRINFVTYVAQAIFCVYLNVANNFRAGERESEEIYGRECLKVSQMKLRIFSQYTVRRGCGH